MRRPIFTLRLLTSEEALHILACLFFNVAVDRCRSHRWGRA